MHPDSVLTEREVTDHDLAIENERLRQALERTERNLLLSVRRQPVRDLAENLAENAWARGDA